MLVQPQELRSKIMASWRHVFAAIGALLMVSELGTAHAQHRVISMGFDSLQVRDEDDDFDNDEPYLIAVGFRVRYGANQQPVPDSLMVTRLLGRHNNMYINNDDDWAEEGKTINLRSSLARSFEEVIPVDEPNWLIGTIFVFMEEDEFDNSMVDAIARQLTTIVTQALQNGALPASDVRDAGKQLLAQYLGGIESAVQDFDIGGMIDEFAKAVRPDDIGGVKLMLAATTPRVGEEGTNVMTYFGDLPNDEQWSLVDQALRNPSDLPRLLAARATLNEIGTLNENATGALRTAFHFPSRGWVSQVPWIARFQGSAVLRGHIRVVDIPTAETTPRGRSTSDRLPGEWSMAYDNSHGRLFLYYLPDDAGFLGARMGTYYPLTADGRLDRARASRVMRAAPILGNQVSFSLFPNNDPENTLRQQGSDFKLLLFKEGSGPDTMAGPVGQRTGYVRKGGFLTEPRRSTVGASAVEDWKHYPGRWSVVYNGRHARMLRVELLNISDRPVYRSPGRTALRAWFEDEPDNRFWLWVDTENPREILFASTWWPGDRLLGGPLNCKGQVLGVEPLVIAGTDWRNYTSRARWHGFHMVRLEHTPAPAPQSLADLQAAAAGLGYYDEFATDASLLIVGAVLQELVDGSTVGVKESVVTFTPVRGGGSMTARTDSSGEFSLRGPKGLYDVIAAADRLRSESRRVDVDRSGRRVVLRLPPQVKLPDGFRLTPATGAEVLRSAGSPAAPQGSRVFAGPQPEPPRQIPGASITRASERPPLGAASAVPRPQPPKSAPTSTLHRGQVVAPSSTRPGSYLTVAGARLEWFDVRGVRRATTMSGRNGQYSVNLPDGVYRVTVKAPQGLQDDNRKVQIAGTARSSRIVLRRETTPQTLQDSTTAKAATPSRITDAGSTGERVGSNSRVLPLLKVTVVSSAGAPQSGNPLAGAKITAIGRDGRRYAATASPSGLAVLTVPTGSYRIQAIRSGYSAGSALVAVSSRGAAVTVVLAKSPKSVVLSPRGPRQSGSHNPPARDPAPAEVNVTVIDSSTKKPIRGATVTIDAGSNGQRRCANPKPGCTAPRRFPVHIACSSPRAVTGQKR
jgi:hypothetical protein